MCPGPSRTSAPGTQELSITVEVLDPPVAHVEDIEGAVGREGDGAVAIAVRTLQVELAILAALVPQYSTNVPSGVKIAKRLLPVSATHSRPW